MSFYLEQILISFASHLHLAVFAPVASFLEELIPPIPSPSVVIVTGSLASIQGYLFYGLVILALLAALGKTGGAGVVYYVSDKIEDLLANNINKFLGITHEQIEAFGAKLSQNWWDLVILTFLRALPIIPSSLLSVGCGLLKVNFKIFIISTFIGSVIRDFIYIYVGYVGTKVAISFFKKTSTTIESYIQLVTVLLIVIFLGYLYYRRFKNKKQ